MHGVDGRMRVRADFNPSKSEPVDHIKGMTADLIDFCEEFKTNGERARCAALAQTKYEEAAMWAVKAATYKP
jgi:hypothetical protein